MALERKHDWPEFFRVNAVVDNGVGYRARNVAYILVRIPNFQNIVLRTQYFERIQQSLDFSYFRQVITLMNFFVGEDSHP
jgi:hypothetical protein